MLTLLLIFVAIVAFVGYRRRKASGSPISLASFVPVADPDDTPQAARWEKRLVNELLDDKRRADAQAKLLAELQSLGKPASTPAAVSESRPSLPVA